MSASDHNVTDFAAHRARRVRTAEPIDPATLQRVLGGFIHPLPVLEAEPEPTLRGYAKLARASDWLAIVCIVGIPLYFAAQGLRWLAHLKGWL